MSDIGPAQSSGNSTLITSPEYLVQPEDLPENLKLERLDKKEISEWVIQFNIWLKSSFVFNTIKPLKSQFEVNKMIAFGKFWLQQFRNQSTYESNFEAVIGHELAHCYYNHTKKMALINWAWSLVSILTLGISSLFTRHFMAPHYKKAEKDADIFSAKKFGTDGLINLFSDHLEAGKSLHKKYPERIDAHGNSLHDHFHPSFTKRINYLQKLKNFSKA